MTDVDRSLRETLSSGASRVFNVAEISRRLAENGSDDRLFATRALNDAVFIKRPKDAIAPSAAGTLGTTAEIMENGELKTIEIGAPARVEKGDIATILYLPYDTSDIVGGGGTVELGGRGGAQALLDLTGLDIRSEEPKSARDAALLEHFDDLPSLDPFLLKDKLEIEGLDAPEAYFEISEAEFQEIKKFIIGKFSRITEKVIDPNAKNAQQVAEQFIMKLWEGKDLAYLRPVTKVFRIDPDDALEIYYSWKGVTYYEFQYKRGQRTLLSFVEWLQTKAMPEQYMKPVMRAELEELILAVTSAVARHLKNSSDILRVYNDAYEGLFIHGGDSRPFIDFLGESQTLFWDVAASISAMNHGVSVWQQRTKSAKDGKLSVEELKKLLELLDRVVV